MEETAQIKAIREDKTTRQNSVLEKATKGISTTKVGKRTIQGL